MDLMQKDKLCLKATAEMRQQFKNRLRVIGGCHFLGDGRRRPGISFKGVRVVAARFSLIVATGIAPKKMLACHTCKNSTCVNAKHLYWGTPSQNNFDMDRDGTRNQPTGFRHAHAKITGSIAARIAVEYVDGKYSQGEIARRYGVSIGTVDNIVNRKAWKNATKHIEITKRSSDVNYSPYGESVVQSKLTESQALAALRLFEQGESALKIAEMFNVNRKTVQDLRNNETWKHLPRLQSFEKRAPRVEVIVPYQTAAHVYRLYHQKGFTCPAIAELKNMTLSVVRRIVDGSKFPELAKSIKSTKNIGHFNRIENRDNKPPNICIACGLPFAAAKKRKKTCSRACLIESKRTSVKQAHKDGKIWRSDLYLLPKRSVEIMRPEQRPDTKAKR